MPSWTINALLNAYTNGETTVNEVAQQYINKIQETDKDGPNAVIVLNPHWHEQALALQASLSNKKLPLHGIPILIKDNIDTVAMGNSAGSIALKDVPVAEDAPIIKKLTDAGALILGKTNLSEWANFRSTDSVSGWSSLGGQTRNAASHDHSPSGSSSGSAAAVYSDYCVFAIGTETDGSIVSPASHNSVVGLKPTLGRVSRTGIIPIAWSQDTAGPIGKSVEDCALVLNVLTGEDAQDPITQTAPTDTHDFTELCSSEFIKGKRIGYLNPDDQFPPGMVTHFEKVIRTMEQAGAICIELQPVPATVTLQDHEITILTSEFPEALEKYIAERRPASKLKTLEDFTRFNLEHSDEVLSRFKQEWFDRCLQCQNTESQHYKAAQSAIEVFKQELNEQWFEQHNLDAVVCATNGPAWPIEANKTDRYTGGNSFIAAVSGWPSITVPYDTMDGLPLGALLIGKPWSESKTIGIAHSFEKVMASSDHE